MQMNFHAKILVVPRGNYICWTSTQKSQSSLEAITFARLPREDPPPPKATTFVVLPCKDPCCLLRQTTEMDFHGKILTSPQGNDIFLGFHVKMFTTPRGNFIYQTSTRRSLSRLNPITFVGLPREDHCNLIIENTRTLDLHWRILAALIGYTNFTKIYTPKRHNLYQASET